MRILLFLVFLVGCSSPAMRFSGVEPVRVSLGGARFDVYALADTAQAIRLDREMLPNKAVTIAKGIAAIEQATGCRVRANSVSGDAALITADLDCP